VDVCPQNCLQLIPLRQFAFTEEDIRQIADRAAYDPILLQHLTPEEVAAGAGSVMVKDETICIRCGLCAERCPAHTITMEAFEVFDSDPPGEGAVTAAALAIPEMNPEALTP
jgi:NAD-dependent dihydropyrimidine dehydrogenase PreA subunit